MIKTKPNEDPIGCRFPAATGSILFRGVPEFNSDFIKAATLHELQSNPSLSELSADEFNEQCMFMGVKDTAAALRLLCGTYDPYTYDRDEPPGMAGNNVLADVHIVDKRGDNTFVVHTDMSIPITWHIVPMPRWADSHIQLLSTYQGKTDLIDYQLVFYIAGERDDESNFATTVEQWWRRMMSAVCPRLAICNIDDGGNSCILNENDTDTEFMSVLGDRTFDNMESELPDNYTAVQSVYEDEQLCLRERRIY